jgi:hypothetical protein
MPDPALTHDARSGWLANFSLRSASVVVVVTLIVSERRCETGVVANHFGVIGCI